MSLRHEESIWSKRNGKRPLRTVLFSNGGELSFIANGRQTYLHVDLTKYRSVLGGTPQLAAFDGEQSLRQFARELLAALGPEPKKRKKTTPQEPRHE